MKKVKKAHFLGINGSGIVGTACLAKKYGFDVDGCDIVKSGSYSKQLENLGIEVKASHSPDHLDEKDLLIVSPAVFFKDKYKDIEEIVRAEERGVRVLKWQKFLDEYLVNNRYFITICGTHGKTSTTTITSNLLTECALDPTCVVGGINPRWGTSFRYGKGDYFVCEADEYGHNFHSYHPNCIILNNVEMEHPEFFSCYQEYEENFIEFIRNLKKGGLLIFDVDDLNSLTIVLKLREFLTDNEIKVVAFTTIDNNPKVDFIKVVSIKILTQNSFIYNGKHYVLQNITGFHNIHNVLNVLILGEELNIDAFEVKDSIENTILPKRRMEVIFENEKIKLYDDYAHHHSQVFCNLSTLKNNLKENEKIIAVLEPHLISRFKDNYREFLDYMEIADYSVITKFFKSREEDLPDLNMKDYLVGRKTQYVEDFDDVLVKVNNIVSNNQKIFYHIVIMGSGLSYKLSNKIKEYNLKEEADYAKRIS